MRLLALESEDYEPFHAQAGRQRARLVYKACRHCDRPVTLRYSPSATLRLAVNVWPCPYDDCSGKAMNQIILPGALLNCWSGHGSEPPSDGSAT